MQAPEEGEPLRCMRNEAQLPIAEVDHVGRLRLTPCPSIGSLIDLLLIDITSCFQIQVLDDCQQILRLTRSELLVLPCAAQ
jgi:hypothetical protein